MGSLGGVHPAQLLNFPAHLFRIQFDDQLFVQLDLHQVFPLGEALDFAFEGFAIHVDPVGGRCVGGGVTRGQDRRVILAAFPDRNQVADFHQRRGDVALAAVDFNVTVAHDLAGLVAAGAETDAVDDAVQTALQVVHQIVAGDTLLQGGLFEAGAELALQHAVNAADFLLFAKLQAVADDLRFAILAMLSGDEVALFDGALLAVTALAFEIEFHPLAPALPADGTDVSCHLLRPYLSSYRCGLQPGSAFFPLTYWGPGAGGRGPGKTPLTRTRVL